MKTIAVLTMLFLPGTFVATVFQSPFMRYTQWWQYVAVTLPLTIIIMVIWFSWVQLLSISTFITKSVMKRFRNRN